MSNPLSAVGICNLALNRIGVLQSISSISPPDNTPAGAACAAAYDICRQELLHDFPWGWASKYVTLTQISTPGTRANAEWVYAYTYPTDALVIRRLFSAPTDLPLFNSQEPTPTWDRADTEAYPWPWEVGYASGTQVVYTDLQNAACKYTFDQGDTAPFTPEFSNIFAWRLAVELADSLANSDQRRDKAEKAYDKARTEGAAHALNEQQNSKPFQPGNTQSIRGRFIG